MLKTSSTLSSKRQKQQQQQYPTALNKRIKPQAIKHTPKRRFNANNSSSRGGPTRSQQPPGSNEPPRQPPPRSNAQGYDTTKNNTGQDTTQVKQQPTQTQVGTKPTLQTEQPQKETLFKTTNTARVSEDVAVDTSVTREHLARFAHLLQINSPDTNHGRMVYNTSSGAHPAMTFALYPNPLTNPREYETALYSNKIYPRYSYNQDVDGSLEHIRGVHYLPQYGRQHLLSQGRIEIFHPFLLNHQLQYVIQAGTAENVDKREKHRDRIELSSDGKLIGLHPTKNSNLYYTAVEHNQIQTKDGKLCADYQVQHLFYNHNNDIIVSPKEQRQRQKLEQVYESLRQAKAQDLLDELRELTIRTNVEILPDKTQSARSLQLQLNEDLKRKRQLERDIDELTSAPSTDERYWDITANSIRIRKSDVYNFLTLTSNNNKICFNDRFASYNGHDGTVVPMEYLATLALHHIANFTAEFAPPEPQVWKDVRHEALVLEQEHLRDELLREKTIKWKAYTKFRQQQRKTKQDRRYEEIYREHQRANEVLQDRTQDRRDGKTTGVFRGLMDTREAFINKQKYKKLPLPEEIQVSEDEDGRDAEFEVFQNEVEITLNKEEIDYIKEKTTPPPWHNTFQQLRRFEFRSLAPLTITGKKSAFLEQSLDSQYTELNFYARLTEDSFDYHTYASVLTGAMDEFDLQLKQLRAGLIKEHDINLGKMISFSDICRDKPLEIEVWFELPQKDVDELKARAERIRAPDPRIRPTTGTRIFTGIVTFDAPSSYHFMGLTEDQMKRLFALRQGVTITKM